MTGSASGVQSTPPEAARITSHTAPPKSKDSAEISQSRIGRLAQSATNFFGNIIPDTLFTTVYCALNIAVVPRISVPVTKVVTGMQELDFGMTINALRNTTVITGCSSPETCFQVFDQPFLNELGTYALIGCTASAINQVAKRLPVIASTPQFLRSLTSIGLAAGLVVFSMHSHEDDLISPLKETGNVGLRILGSALVVNLAVPIANLGLKGIQYTVENLLSATQQTLNLLRWNTDLFSLGVFSSKPPEVTIKKEKKA